MFPAWSYKKAITITGQSGAGTDYTVKLEIGASASASGYDFHVEGNSAAFPSGYNQSGDLRFANAAEDTELDFWVEKVSGSGASAVATVWVEVRDNLDTNKDIYCYYGNSAAANASDGDAAFIFFDDFEDGTLNKWTVPSGRRGWFISTTNPYNGTYHARMDKSVTTDTYPMLEVYGLSKIPRIECRARENVGSVGGNFGFRNGIAGGATGEAIWLPMIRSGSTFRMRWFGSSSGSTDIGYSYSRSDYLHLIGQYEGGNVWRTEMRNNAGTLLTSRSATLTSAYEPSKIPNITMQTFSIGTANPVCEFDQVIVRNFVSTEPSYNSAGAEESNGGGSAQNPLYMIKNI